MPTLHTSLLTITGLLTSLAAAAQPPVAAAGPQPVDVLGWITWGAAFIVLLMAMITSVSAASAAQRSYAEAAKPAPAPLLTAATTSASRPTLTPPVAAEAVAA